MNLSWLSTSCFLEEQARPKAKINNGIVFQKRVPVLLKECLTPVMIGCQGHQPSNSFCLKGRGRVGAAW